jgi:hypothetical protein
MPLEDLLALVEVDHDVAVEVEIRDEQHAMLHLALLH